jgi:hypothetical protein
MLWVIVNVGLFRIFNRLTKSKERIVFYNKERKYVNLDNHRFGIELIQLGVPIYYQCIEKMYGFFKKWMYKL